MNRETLDALDVGSRVAVITGRGRVTMGTVVHATSTLVSVRAACWGEPMRFRRKDGLGVASSAWTTPVLVEITPEVEQQAARGTLLAVVNNRIDRARRGGFDGVSNEALAQIAELLKVGG